MYHWTGSPTLTTFPIPHVQTDPIVSIVVSSTNAQARVQMYHAPGRIAHDQHACLVGQSNWRRGTCWDHYFFVQQITNTSKTTSKNQLKKTNQKIKPETFSTHHHHHFD
jgi:hypothetical protein